MVEGGGGRYGERGVVTDNKVKWICSRAHNRSRQSGGQDDPAVNCPSKGLQRRVVGDALILIHLLRVSHLRAAPCGTSDHRRVGG